MQMSMMQVYIKNSDQAVEFYQNVFGAEVLIYGKHENGTIVHAEQNIFGQIFAFCETPEQKPLQVIRCNSAWTSAREKNNLFGKLSKNSATAANSFIMMWTGVRLWRT